MSILINIQNEQEEKVLIAFLKSLNFKFKTIADTDENLLQSELLNVYNQEIEDAEKEINAGEFISHEEVETILSERRKIL